MQIKFEDPEPSRRRGLQNPWPEIADELRRNPNRWALIAEDYWASLGSFIRSGTYKDFRPAGSFEATARKVNQKTGKAERIYARYVGHNN